MDPSWLATPLKTFIARAEGAEYGADSSDKVLYYGDAESADDIEEMKEAAKNVDACFFFVSTNSGEGGDRDSLG